MAERKLAITDQIGPGSQEGPSAGLLPAGVTATNTGCLSPQLRDRTRPVPDVRRRLRHPGQEVLCDPHLQQVLPPHGRESRPVDVHPYASERGWQRLSERLPASVGTLQNSCPASPVGPSETLVRKRASSGNQSRPGTVGRVIESTGESSALYFQSEGFVTRVWAMPPKLKPNQPCYCGSGKKYRDCHAAQDQSRQKFARQARRLLIWMAAIAVVGAAIYGLSTSVAYGERALQGAINFSGFTSSQKRTALKEANAARCTCGCGMTLAQCVATDSTCPIRSDNIARINGMLAAAMQ